MPDTVLFMRALVATFSAVLLFCSALPLFAADLPAPAVEAHAWLRYAPLEPASAKVYSYLPSTVVTLDDSPVQQTAGHELMRALEQMLGRKPQLQQGTPGGNAIVLGTVAEIQKLDSTFRPSVALSGDGYWLTTAQLRGYACLLIVGGTNRGVLYGVFSLLSKIARGEALAAINAVDQPYTRIRWVNQWDNLNGHIERGYGGPSIFFEVGDGEDGNVRADLTRARQYARLLASIGINGCTINNVNADPRILDDAFIPQIKRIADVFRPWGVQLSLAVDLSSPKALGELDTFDPLDPRVAAWWKKKADEIFAQIPDFAGFLIKADSEGRSGPSTYHRTHADAANMIARALKPHGGVVFYRAFVYNHHLDWHDLKADRAKAAYDNFHPLDGDFDDNVIIQIKNGPIDFQVREPVSPLFAGLRRTNEAIELQITQEYTGQQRQLCFLVPMWKEALDFDMRIDDQHTPVKAIAAGRVFHRPAGGFVGTANVGMDANWLGSPLAMANLFGFGRLAWNPDLSAETIVDEWTRLTFGNDPAVVRTINSMLLNSWPIYESYTGPLGVGTLTNILGNHYDPAPESSENNGWGQWHRADRNGIGMDRTIATGTGFIAQYPPAVQKLYETTDACPDNLLLFFHHVPYTHLLHSGKTVIQYFYDSHYDGAERAADFVAQWQSLRGHVDEPRYLDILPRFQYQAQEAIVWRDTICRWLYELSGIPDQQARVKKAKQTVP
jgi:alpha-glucuronidase